MKIQRRILALLALLSVVTYLDRVLISVAGPRMQEELNIGPEAWGWVVGAFAAAYAVFEIPSGRLGDRFGPRRVLTRIVLWWSAFTVLTGMVSSYYLLVATRFAFGAGEAGAYPNTSASISRWFPPDQRSRAFGMIWMASQAGAALTPLLVVPIQMRFGWRASFFLFGLAGALWALVWRRSHGDEPQAPASKTSSHVLPWRLIFRSGNLWAVMMVALAYCYGMYFFLAWLHTFLVKGRGFSEQSLALSSLPFVLGALANACGGYAGDVSTRRLGLKWGRRAMGITGLLVAGLAMLAVPFAHGKAAVLVLLGLCYGGITFQQPSVWAVCLDIGGGHAGVVSASMNTAAQIGSLLLSISFGYMVNLFGSYDLPLLPVGLMLLAGALLWLVIDPTRSLLRDAT